MVTDKYVPGGVVKNGVTYRVITDYLGSPRVAVNGDTGEVVAAWDWDEFGNLILAKNEGFLPFGFAGGLRDSDTGLVRFGARDYDCETGRWLSKEPLGFDGSGNFYSYCDGEPVNWVDVDGMRRIRVQIFCRPLSESKGIYSYPGKIFPEFFGHWYIFSPDVDLKFSLTLTYQGKGGRYTTSNYSVKSVGYAGGKNLDTNCESGKDTLISEIMVDESEFASSIEKVAYNYDGNYDQVFAGFRNCQTFIKSILFNYYKGKTMPEDIAFHSIYGGFHGVVLGSVGITASLLTSIQYGE